LAKKNIIHYGMRLLGRYVIFNAYRAIDDRLTKLQFLSDEALQKEIRSHLDGTGLKDKPKTPLVMQLFTRLFRFFAIRVHRSETMDAIAVAVEAFRRAPADLPEGSRLYPQQIEAALGLTQPLLIEMDTGEGKTYACLPAAFTLLLRFRKVYIICANEYLAWRDANRTRPYWDFLGVPTGLGIKQCADSEWGQAVVYTTLDNLIFREMLSELSRKRSRHPMVFGALILDEADVILLDQASRAYSIIHPLSTKGFNWGQAIEIAGKLVNPEHVLVERENFSARLTLAGEKLVQEQLGDANSSDVLIWYTAVEVSYLGTRLARKDFDYVVEGQKVHPVDRITGRIMRSQRERWLPPLEYALGLPPRPRNINLHTMTPGWFLNQFAFISGMSGTIQDDAIEYLFAYYLPSIKIEPRRPRFQGLAPDLVFRDDGAMFHHLAAEIVDRHRAGRPVLVGTQSIADAQNFFAFLQERLPDSARAQLLTGKNEREMADLFKAAGQTDSVMVTTQLAGRGVDIRLSDRARENGGLALYSIGHAKDARYDRQFLGRAGRQGDPFTAQFYCSLEDNIISTLIRNTRKAVILQIVGDEPVSSGIVDRALKRAQWDFKLTKFIRRRSGYPYFKLNWEIWNDIRVWFEYSKPPYPADQKRVSLTSENDRISDYFLGWVVDHFLRNHVMIRPVKMLELGDAETIADTVNVLLEDADGLIKASDLEGKTLENALETLKAMLVSHLQAQMKYRQETLSKCDEILSFYHRACDGLTRLDENLMKAHFQADPSLLHAIEATLKAIQDHADHFSAMDPCVDQLLALLKKVFPAKPTALSRMDPPGLEKPEANPQEPQASSKAALPSGEGDAETLARTESPELESDTTASWATTREKEDVSGEAPRRQAGVVPESEETNQTVADVGESAPGFEVRDRLRKRLTEVYRVLMAYYKDAVRQIDRNPNQIAYWSIATNWAAFIEERDRLEFRLKKRFANSDEYFYAVKGETRRTWQRMEKRISTDVLKHLLRMNQVKSLDDLFFLKENKASTQPAQPEPGFEWSPNRPAPEKAEEKTDHGARLLTQFLSQDETWLGKLGRFGQAKLRRLITDFNREFPTFVLQSPEKIYRAYEDWFALERERGIPNDERQKHRKWLKVYLQFLSRNHHIGKLPKMTNKLKSKFERLSETVKDLKMVLVSALTAVALLIYFLSLRYGNFRNGPELNVFFSQMDLFLFGGRIAQGNFLAPLVGAQLLLLMAFRAMYKNVSEVFVVNKSILVLPLYAIFLVWVFQWRSPLAEPGAFAGQLGLFLLSMYLFTLFLKCQLMVQQQSQLSLLGFFVAYQAAMAIWWMAWLQPSQSFFPWLVLGGSLVLLQVVARLNHYELAVSSSRVKTVESMESESVQTLLAIKASPGVAPHVIAILATGTLYEILELVSADVLGARGTWLFTGFYLLVAGSLILVHANQTFALQNWLNYLSDKRLDAGDVAEGGQFHRWLQRCWLQSLLRQFGCYLVLVLLLGWGFADLNLPDSSFPVLPLLLFATVVLQRYGHEVLSQTHAFLMSKVRAQSDLVQLSLSAQPPGDESLLDRIKRLLNNKLATTISILIVLAKAALLLKAVITLLFGNES